MAPGPQQLVLRLRPEVRNSVVEFAKDLYAECLFGDDFLLDYHANLYRTTIDVVCDYFNSLDSLNLSSDAANRLTTICEAAWLSSAISRCGCTLDDVFDASDDRVSSLVSACTQDARLLAPQRTAQLVGQLPNLCIDARLLLLSEQITKAGLLRRANRFVRGDIKRILIALSAFNSFPPLQTRIKDAITILGETKL